MYGVIIISKTYIVLGIDGVFFWIYYLNILSPRPCTKMCIARCVYNLHGCVALSAIAVEGVMGERTKYAVFTSQY